MSKHIISILVLSLLLSCNNGSTPTSASYEETKMDLAEQEQGNPAGFLSIDATYRKNLAGEFVLEGRITNAATVATFKDVVLNVKFYSKTETLLGNDRVTVYEFFPPGQTKRFRVKFPAYTGSKQLGWEVESALPAE